MLTKRIIPCLDVKDGQVVKGIKFKKHQVVGDIVQLAEEYSRSGADELVFYDITASAEKREIDYKWVARIARKINIPFAVGGGIKDVAAMKKVLRLGADKISINSPALADPGLINQAASILGSQCIVVGIDSRRVDGEDWVFQYTGSVQTMRQTRRKTLNWIREATARGAGEIVLNSMDEDGTKAGYNLRLLKKASRQCRVPLIASGGAGRKEDFLRVLAEADVDGALAAGIFHRKELTIPDLKRYLIKQNLNIRL